MDAVREAVVNLPYAFFALQQPVLIDELHPATDKVAMRASKPQSPEWFAAAASDEASLLQTAPELVAVNSGDEQSLVKPDSDIIDIYAPGSKRPHVIPLTPTDEDVVIERDDSATPRTSVQFGLLAELSDLDP